jgi:hypothetical protein
VYSLGVLLYELLTGRLPYSEETIYGLVEKHSRREPFPRPRELRREIPQVVDEALLDALEVDPKKRLGSMKEFGRRIAQGLPNGDRLLQTLAARLFVDRPALPNEPTLTGDVESSITQWTPARSIPSTRRPWLVPATVAALAGTAVGALAMHVLDGGASAPPAIAAGEAQTGTPEAHAAGIPVTIERGGRQATGSAAPAAATAPPEAKAPGATTPQDDRAADRPPMIPQAPRPPADSSAQASPPKPEPAARSTPARAPSAPPASAEPVATKLEPARSAGKPPPRQIESTVGQPPSKPADLTASTATEGALVVRTHTWADVWVNGKRRGTAPLRLRLPVGRYTVKLTNDLHDETVPVNVGATETVIEKSW